MLKGSGLSSSAAFEVLIGNILNDLFFDGKCTAVELAQFCSTRLGRTPPLGGWESISHGEFFLLIVELLGG